MTPFGKKVRAMRTERGIAQKEMAAAIGVSPAYLSALEHGRRGVPNWAMVQKIIGFFNVIWDEAEALEDLARRSDPRVTVATAGLSPEATLLANRLAAQISMLSPDDIEQIVALLDEIDQKSASRSSSRSLTSQP
ncbi:MAG: helix-turn-helix domain-containing protein [Aliihoeflea sp.]|uniref:helix-turn-helix domain-containing protein n=1 Tax=Aliihoeflea sp. TaxID=2608088 RepID=UPI0040333C99